MANAEQDMDHAEDAADLRAQLKLAQERLATYQKFDRDIAENVRRSSELMLEAMQVRDRMDRDASDQARARQERLAGKLQSLQADLTGVREQVASLLERVVALREDIETESDDVVQETTDDVSDAARTASEASARSDDADKDEAAVEAEPDVASGEPRSVDLIAHGMTRAASALALQSHLRGLSQVEAVDAREFSSGILRLHLSLAGALPDEDLVGWEGDDEVTILRHLDDAIELRIGE